MIHYWGNMFEGVFWIVIAGVIYYRTRDKSEQERQIAGRAGTTFFWFGISDFIEVSTGAWYRPFGLLVMKGICVMILLHCLVKYWAMKKGQSEVATVLKVKRIL